MTVDTEDYRDLLQDLDSAHRMVAEIAALLRRWCDVWDSRPGVIREDRMMVLYDESYDLLQQLDPRGE